MPHSEDGSGRIIIDGLCKRFGAATAVDGLTFTAQPAMLTGLLGPTGAGKTSTLRILLGVGRPDGGSATVDGVRFAELRHPARVVGAVLGGQGFHPGRTARQHLRAYAAAIDVPDARAEEVLALVGLTGAASERTRRFSPGMRRRLALATALLGDPQVLVLDEPAEGLDPDGIRWMSTLLRELARDGRTVLMSGHQLGVLEQAMDAVVIIRAGAAVFAGPPEDLRAGRAARVLVACADAYALAHALVAFGLTDVAWVPDGRLAVGAADSQQIARIGRSAGIAVYGMTEEVADLQRAFLALTAGPPPDAAGPPSVARHPTPPDPPWASR